MLAGRLHAEEPRRGPFPGAAVSVFLSTGAAAPAAERFGCAGRIYAKMNLSRFDPAGVPLEARWVNPAGQIQEKTVLPSPSRRRRPRVLSTWIAFHPTGNTIFDEFSVGPGARERTPGPLHGSWRFQLYEGDRLLAEKEFRVQCMEE